MVKKIGMVRGQDLCELLLSVEGKWELCGKKTM